MPCEDCGVLLEPDSEWYSSGPAARVCRSCQNKRYEAKIAGTPKGERRKRRKALLAKKRRLEARIERDHGELASVLRELQADPGGNSPVATRGWPPPRRPLDAAPAKAPEGAAQ